MRILRAADHRRMPWKNGGGETTEIAVFPEGAGLDEFDWRVSMARVDVDGPFSSFPGIERTLAILEGAGLILNVHGRGSKLMTQQSEPYPFPADVPTSAALVAGTVLDFNVMSRRDKVVHRVQRRHRASTTPGGIVRLVLCTSGIVEVNTVASSARLGCYDATVLPADEAAELAPKDDGHFYLVEFRAA